MTAPYTAGTIGLVSGSSAVVGTDTAWEVSLIIGGTIYVEFDGGNPMPIATVDSDTEITAALKWTGPTGTYSYAIVRDTAYGQQTVTNAQALATYIQRLNNPALAATAGVTPGSNKLLLFTGANSATVIDLEDLLQGVKFDEEVPTLADRAPYDGEAEGFRVLVANIGDGRSAFYTKKSAAVGDWTVPFYITGPVGGAGPYTDITIGPTETLPAGADAEVTLVPVSPGVIRLDFGLPKGADGTGTGDVGGPAGGVADGDISAFNGATGKLIKLAETPTSTMLGRSTAGTGKIERLTPAQARQVLGGWEFINAFSLDGLSLLDVTGLSPFIVLRMSFHVIMNAQGSFNIRYSSDNGATFYSDSDEHRYTLQQGNYNASTNTKANQMDDGSASSFPIGDHNATGLSSVVSVMIANFNKARTTVGELHGILYQNSENRVVRHLGDFDKRAVAMNAFRVSLTVATTIQQGRLYLEGIRG